MRMTKKILLRLSFFCLVFGFGLIVLPKDAYAMCPCARAYLLEEYWFLDDEAGDQNAVSGWNSGATAQDTDITGVAKETNFRLRIETQETNGNDEDFDFLAQLEYAESASSCSDTGVTWYPVSGVSAKVIYSTSSNFTSPVASSERLIVSDAGGPSFVAGEIVDDRNPTADKGAYVDQDSEDEWVLQFTASAANETPYKFRITDNGSTTNWTYAGCPTATTAVAATTTLTQNNWQLYVDAAALNPSDPWGNPNLGEKGIMTSLPISNDPLDRGDNIRLRMTVQVSGATLAASTEDFILQYRETNDCTDGGTWTDVDTTAGSGIWKFYDNTSVTDDTQLATTILTGSDKVGRYNESDPTSTNPVEVLFTPEDFEWDWNVEYNGNAEAHTYCFRMAINDGGASPLHAYNATSYPEVETRPGAGDQMRHGNFFTTNVKRGFSWAD